MGSSIPVASKQPLGSIKTLAFHQRNRVKAVGEGSGENPGDGGRGGGCGVGKGVGRGLKTSFFYAIDHQFLFEKAWQRSIFGAFSI